MKHEHGGSKAGDWVPPPPKEGAGYPPGMSLEEQHKLFYSSYETRRRLRLEPPRALSIERDSAATEDRVCSDHGPYMAECFQPKSEKLRRTGLAWFQPRWTGCPQCQRIMQSEINAADAEIRDGMSQKDRFMNARLDAANMPARFRDVELWQWQHGMDRQRRIYDWARDYCAQFELVLECGRSGIFLGAPGTGKSMLACAMLRALLEKGATGYYTPLMDMLGRIKATYSNTATESEASVVKMLTGVDLLVIDEVGRSLDTQFETSQLFRVIDDRYRNRKPTVIVSNLSKPKLAEFLGVAAMDRMTELGGAIHVFDWASQRNHGTP